MMSKIKVTMITCIFSVMLFQATAYANSSWHWVTMSPLSVLPICIIVTLLIEAYSIVKINEIKYIKKVFAIVCVANLLSFVVPIIDRGLKYYPIKGSITRAIEGGPYYIVLTGYLILTLIIEIPVVFILLKSSVKSKKKLFITVLCANIITTILVAIIERTVCVGQW